MPKKKPSSRKKSVSKPKKRFVSKKTKSRVQRPPLKQPVTIFNTWTGSPSPSVSYLSPHRSEDGLPERHFVTKLVLMIRDPEWAFVYWDFDHAKEEWMNLLRAKGGCRTVLRVYDVTDIEFNGLNASRQWDIDIDLEAFEWYLNLTSPNRSFVIELGIIDSFGQFHAAVRSNTVRMPRLGPSEFVDEEWMSPDFEDLYAFSGGFMLGGASEQVSSFSFNWQHAFSSDRVSSLPSLKKKKFPPFPRKKRSA